MKNKRMAYLVINNKINEFNLYTDKRKVKALMKIYNDLDIYVFKCISSNEWDGEYIYNLNYNGTENKIEMFKENFCYTDLGCFIMKSLAKAKWNSSIKYPDNGWNICSICGDITNEIDKCLFCGNFVCWECSCEVVNNDWDEGHYCSYECYRKYLENKYNISYNPKEEHKEKICNRLDYILESFDQEKLFNILLEIESKVCNKEELEDFKLNYKYMNEEKLLNIINNKNVNDVCDVLLDLYEDETNEELYDLLDGEAYVNSLDPNDPADAWFFED